MSAYSIEHAGVAADDPESVAAWYVAMLGFREFFRTEGTPPVIFLEDPSGAKLEIFPRKAGDRKPAYDDRTGSHLAIAVADYDDAVEDLERRGVVFTSGTLSVFVGGKARFFSDPEGNRLHIVYRPSIPWAGSATRQPGMQPKIGFIHSTRLVLPLVEAAASVAGVDQLHISDDTLVRELVESKAIGAGLRSRVLTHTRSLQDRGCGRIILTCSSLSPLVDALADELSVPFVKIDAPMMEDALSLVPAAGQARVAIIATNPTTEAPSRLLAYATVRGLTGAGRAAASWEFVLLPQAFAALSSGDKEGHDAAVVRAAEELSARFDRVLFAQVSMGRVKPRLSASCREKARYSLDYIGTLLGI
jgi:catechol 2,3-dioxygenase-like lactoylglutathione lyase family enzyme